MVQIYRPRIKKIVCCDIIADGGSTIKGYLNFLAPKPALFPFRSVPGKNVETTWPINSP